ncbi:hypothetical protein XSR1_290011 [Xenorhabdus szentirmaii DSM 16338]|uniref:Uncharacterized protein n=1 Tax=Xenorhabdus szentirmaii DSM 16338 TaxID=1427518 RepID=W1IZ32_9GAMM|nr:hypothetical protein XSR1_290011 [Xenorhabdus szentirmaii DSM 16338]
MTINTIETINMTSDKLSVKFISSKKIYTQYISDCRPPTVTRN